MKTYPTLIPCFFVQDTRKAIAFYEKAFGFVWRNQEKAPQDEKGDIIHVEMSYKDVLVMFAPEGAFGSPVKTPASLQIQSPTTLYLYCDDVDQLYQQALAAGAASTMEPHDAFWGDRVCQVADINGYSWMFAKTLEGHAHSKSAC